MAHQPDGARDGFGIDDIRTGKYRLHTGNARRKLGTAQTERLDGLPVPESGTLLALLEKFPEHFSGIMRSL